MSRDLDLSRVLPYLKPLEDGHAADPSDLRHISATPLTRPFVGRLITTYVLDRGSQFEFVSARQAAESEHRVDHIHSHAMQNLARRTDDHELRMPQYHAITPILFDGNLETSFMLFDQFWADIQSQLEQAELLAVAPARDILAFCPVGSVEGRVQLGELIERVWPHSDHRLTRDLYRRTSRGWLVDGSSQPADKTQSLRP